jgi:hypothetical protein
MARELKHKQIRKDKKALGMHTEVSNFGFLIENLSKNVFVFRRKLYRDFFYYCEVKCCLMMVVVRVWGMESRKATMELVLHQASRHFKNVNLLFLYFLRKFFPKLLQKINNLVFSIDFADKTFSL